MSMSRLQLRHSLLISRAVPRMGGIAPLTGAAAIAVVPLSIQMSEGAPHPSTDWLSGWHVDDPLTTPRAVVSMELFAQAACVTAKSMPAQSIVMLVRTTCAVA